MAKLPDKYSIAHAVFPVASGGHPVRPVDVNGVALDDPNQVYSTAHPVLETDINGTVVTDAFKVVSAPRLVTVSPLGIPVITVDTNGNALGTTFGGGVSTFTAVPYDTRWGTATDTSGWITFGLKAGCRRVWLDSINGNDANSGLTTALAVKTWNVAHAIYTGAGCQAGDQLMIAQGSVVTASRGQSMNSVATATANLTNPSAVLSYDPADPTNAAKYGRAIGAAMPIINLDINLGTDLNVVNGAGIGYIALQGLELKAVNQNASTGAGIVWQTNKHPGMVHQNIRFNGVGISNSSGLGTTSSAGNTQNAGLISKCSMWNSTGIFMEETDGYRIQEFFSAHCGWNINALRDDPIVYGGSSTFAHAFYLHASNTNLWLNRVICVDATDGLGARCGSVSANQLISVDNPVGLNSAGKSFDVMLERPDGAPWYCDDAVIMGLDKEICPNQPGGWGLEWSNNIVGSYTNNVAAFDFDQFGYDSAYNRVAAGTRLSSSLPAQYMLLNNWSAYHLAITGETDSVGSDPTNYHFSVTNSILDALPTGLNGAITNVTTRSTPPAGYKTRAQTYAALGYANKAEWVNAMCFRPDLVGQMAQAICGISLPAMGLTPLYQTASPPTVVTGAPIVYPTSLVDLTPSSLNFTRGTPAIIRLTGFAACSTLACSDLPSGFSMTVTRVAVDAGGNDITGTATSGSNQVTSVSYTTGMLPGMLFEMKANAFTNVSLFPAGTVILSVSGSTVTVSNNATANSSGQHVFASSGGSFIRYDGTGTGAATPTIHVVETAKDTAVGTRTTTLTLNIASGVTTATWDATNGVTLADWTLSNGNLTATRSANTSFHAIIRTTTAKASGTLLFTITALGANCDVGLDTGAETNELGHTGTGVSVGYGSTGAVLFGSELIGTFATYTTDDVIKLVKAGASVSFYKNNVLQVTLDTSSATYGHGAVLTGAVYGAAHNSNSTGASITVDASGW